MRIFHPYGSKERLFEMIQRVDGVQLSEGNEEILDFLKIVRADYPDNNEMYSKFLNIAKRKGVDVAKQEYESTHSPLAIKNKQKLDKQHQRTVDKLEKHNEYASKYHGVIELIQYLIKNNGLYDLILSVIQNSNPSNNLVKMVANKKYSNLFNREIKDMVSFQNKYLRHDRNLIPLESVELMEYKPRGWEKEYGEKFGLSLKITSYVVAGVFKGTTLDVEDFVYYNVFLDPDLDSHLFAAAGRSGNYGMEAKFQRMEKIASKYNRRMLNDREFDNFLSEFLEAYNKPEKFYQEKVLSKLNEELLPIEEKNKTINDFIKFADAELGLNGDVPELTISYDSDVAQEMKSFGKYTPGINELVVVAANRNLADVLRTIAHELIHHKQHKDGKITQDSNKTGSEIENEANALAGVLMRNFGQKNPAIFE